ncbi:hypothetical protein B0J17DRAFT_702785 [Rhizoctonia solani]|nr:hypothetical protein B0J17DRAFT_702785 [Rhizoctonia solani]
MSNLFSLKSSKSPLCSGVSLQTVREPDARGFGLEERVIRTLTNLRNLVEWKIKARSVGLQSNTIIWRGALKLNHSDNMAESLPTFEYSSNARFWWEAEQFGIEVNEPVANMNLVYVANENVVQVELLSSNPVVQASARGMRPDNVISGILRYNSSTQYPIPMGPAKATMHEATDLTGQRRLYITFQNISPGSQEPISTCAIFQGKALSAPRASTLNRQPCSSVEPIPPFKVIDILVYLL